MAAEVRPPELAALLDVAERPRPSGWSLRAALVRYAQPQPQRASDLIELVRRAELALRPHLKRLEQDGPAIWAGLADASGTDPLAGLLRALADLDGVGEELSTWAVTASPAERPDAAVDATISGVAAQLEALGIAREERRPPPGARSRG